MTRWGPFRLVSQAEGLQRVVMTRWGSFRLASQAEGLVWLALQVEGVGEPPTSRNDSLGVDVAGVAGGGKERAPNES